MTRPIVNKEFKIEKLSDLPLGTYSQGLLLTETMEGWRNSKPVINTEQCIQCEMCYVYCPEGVIYKENNEIQIDYRFCKGCGICQRECIAQCIQMVKEEK